LNPSVIESPSGITRTPPFDWAGATEAGADEANASEPANARLIPSVLTLPRIGDPLVYLLVDDAMRAR
jgi:hypothetical protein